MAGGHQSCQNYQWNSPWSCGFWVRACLSLRELRPTLACHYCHTCSPSCLWLNTASWSQQRLPHLVKYSTSLMSSSKISWFLWEKQELGPPSVSDCGGSVAWRLRLPVYMASWSLIRSCRIFAIPADPPPSSRHCTSGVQVRVVQVSSRSVQKGQPWFKRVDGGISSNETAMQEIIDEILVSENVKVAEHAAGLLFLFFTCATASIADQRFPVTSFAIKKIYFNFGTFWWNIFI